MRTLVGKIMAAGDIQRFEAQYAMSALIPPAPVTVRELSARKAAETRRAHKESGWQPGPKPVPRKRIEKVAKLESRPEPKFQLKAKPKRRRKLRAKPKRKPEVKGFFFSYSPKERARDEARRQWKRLAARYGRQCLRCDAGDIQLVVDHIIPLHRRGTSDIENLQLLCVSCNFRKGLQIVDYRPFPYGIQR